MIFKGDGMTEEKLEQIYREEVIIANVKLSGFDIIPKEWTEIKKIYLNFINEVDKAYEVYNLENGIKNGN